MEETELGKSLPLSHQRPLRGLALLGCAGLQWKPTCPGRLPHVLSGS